MDMKPDFTEVLEVASSAGHILLENGAEISRVEDIMGRIASYYGVDSREFFVLSNGIFTTGHAGKMEKAGAQASTYANVEFIPLRAIQLSKIVAVNRLSYDIAAGKCSLDEARERLESIRNSAEKPGWELCLGSAFGAGAFAAVFGGGWADCAAAFVSGLLLYVFVLLVSGRYLSKIVGGICNALFASALCIVSYRLGFGHSLGNIIIGAVMPLIPGVPFVNGVRDLANSDYIAGLTRLTDAMLGFLCIGLGVSTAFLLDGWIFSGMIQLTGMTLSPETAGFWIQLLAAAVGTASFAVLFSADRVHYIPSGIIGAAGWAAYLLLVREGGATPVMATLAAAFLVCLLSRFAAIPYKVPAQVFIICGIFPLVPGAGIFWCTYDLLSDQFALSLSSGFLAAKVALAIVFGIIFATELPQRLFQPLRRIRH